MPELHATVPTVQAAVDLLYVPRSEPLCLVPTRTLRAGLCQVIPAFQRRDSMGRGLGELVLANPDSLIWSGGSHDSSLGGE